MISCLFLSLSVVSRSWALVAPSSPSGSSEDVRSTSASVSRSSTAAGGELAPFVLDFDVKRSMSEIPAIDRDDVVVRFFSPLEFACELNIMGVQYLANVTVGGQRAFHILASIYQLHSCILTFSFGRWIETAFLVQLDTGSADFWIHKREGVQVVKQTEQRVKIEYGTGWVSGNVAFAPFTVGDFQVPSQGRE